MVTIIVISNDPHVMLLKERFQPLIKGQICIFSDFEQGLIAVFDKRPASVFIQREINGTAAEVIARQIKGLLRDDSPRIILMGALSGTVQDGSKCFDDSFDFAASEDELCSFFGAQLEKIPYLLWKDGRGPAEWRDVHEDVHNPFHELAQLPASDSLNVSDSFALQNMNNLDDHANISSHQSMINVQSGNEEISALENSTPPSFSEVPFNWSAFPKSSASVSTEIRMNVTEGTIRVEPSLRETGKLASGFSASAVTKQSRQSKPAIGADDFSSFGWGRQSNTQHHRNWLFIAGIIVTAILAAAFYLTGPLSGFIPLISAKPSTVGQPVRQPQRQKVAVELPQHTPVRQGRISALPGIIPPQGKDPAYSSKHPGWERYVSEGLEFLVFRDGTEIKAIQVIALTGSGISEKILSTLLGQSVGIDTYSISETSNKNGYLIQQAVLDGGAELAVYRKVSNKQIRGAVVTVK